MSIDNVSSIVPDGSDLLLSLLTLRLFGSFEARVGGDPLPHLYSKKERWLLILLALRSSREVERPWLAGTLWPESSEERALHYLRMSLTRLRQALGPEAGRIVSLTRHTLSLDLTGADVDFLAFDDGIDRGDPASLERAVALYRGPLLEGCTEEWALSERRVREGACLKALETLATHARSQDDQLTAVSYLARAIALDPLRESLHRTLMELHADGGNFAAAVSVYRDLRETLHREMNVEPSPDTVQLHDRLRSDIGRSGRVCYPAIRNVPRQPPPVRLPRPLTPLIGRGPETAEVVHRMSSSRLVTLIGPGGVGKTRLAIHAAEAVLDDYPGGVWFVDLAPLAEPGRIPAAVLCALGKEGRPDEPPLSTLRNAIRTDALLLVLDNCEHVIAAVAGLAQALLEGCPRLRVLATSREVLRIAGETVYSVPSLSVPSEECEPSVERLLEYEAPRLLLDRIRAASPSFAPTPGNLAAIGTICRRLEGIPLAIEMAAVRARVMPVEAIAERLGEALSLLGRESRTVQSRHQTLVATLDWSYRLLSKEEQQLLRCLSVFAGRWTLEAAEAVGGGDGVSAAEVLDRLTGLVEKSLVVVEESRGQAMYRFLETVRQYAAQRLKEAREAEEARSRHLDYYVALSERAEPELQGQDPMNWRRRLKQEYDNLEAALTTAEAEGGGEQGLRLVGALKGFWLARGEFQEGYTWLARILAGPRTRNPTAARMKALCAMGWLACFRRDSERQWSDERIFYWLDEVTALSIERRDRRSYAEAVLLRGTAAWYHDDLSTADRLLKESLELFRILGDHRGLAAACIVNGMVARRGTRLETDPKDPTRINLALARSFVLEGLMHIREIGGSTALALTHLGAVLIDMGEYSTAGDCFTELLAIADEIGSIRFREYCLFWMGKAAFGKGEYRKACGFLEEQRRLEMENWGQDARREETDPLIEEAIRRLEGA